MTINKETVNTDLLRKIRRCDTFQTDHAEFHFFMYKLDRDPEYKPVEFTMKTDTQKITVSPVKNSCFFTSFKVFTAVLVSVNLFKGAAIWKRVDVLKRFKKSKPVGK